MSSPENTTSIKVEDLPPEFWQRVDNVIDMANEQAKSSSVGEIGLSLIYAAARYNAFEVAKSTGNQHSMQSAKDEAIQHFIAQYNKMLDANMEDYIGNFEAYFKQG